LKIGVIADTHGFFNPQIPQIFEGVQKIIHAGDLGSIKVYEQLSSIAPVIVVRGNHEPDEIPGSLMDPSVIMIEDRKILLTHRLITMTWEYFKEALSLLDPLPFFPGFDLIIFGHAHYPVWDKVQEMYFLNPGYAGNDPHEQKPTAAILEITREEISAEIVNL